MGKSFPFWTAHSPATPEVGGGRGNVPEAIQKSMFPLGEKTQTGWVPQHTFVDPLPEASAKNVLVPTAGLGEVPVFGNHQGEAAS